MSEFLRLQNAPLTLFLRLGLFAVPVAVLPATDCPPDVPGLAYVPDGVRPKSDGVCERDGPPKSEPETFVMPDIWLSDLPWAEKEFESERKLSSLRTLFGRLFGGDMSDETEVCTFDACD